jgi:hypothetical protein
MRESSMLAMPVVRAQQRKQFCAFSALATFYTASRTRGPTHGFVHD